MMFNTLAELKAAYDDGTIFDPEDDGAGYVW